MKMLYIILFSIMPLLQCDAKAFTSLADLETNTQSEVIQISYIDKGLARKYMNVKREQSNECLMVEYYESGAVKRHKMDLQCLRIQQNKKTSLGYKLFGGM